MTYDNILRLSDDPDVNDAIKFLREREIVHFQRFGEANRTNFSKYIIHPPVLFDAGGCFANCIYAIFFRYYLSLGCRNRTIFPNGGVAFLLLISQFDNHQNPLPK